MKPEQQEEKNEEYRNTASYKLSLLAFVLSYSWPTAISEMEASWKGAGELLLTVLLGAFIYFIPIKFVISKYDKLYLSAHQQERQKSVGMGFGAGIGVYIIGMMLNFFFDIGFAFIYVALGLIVGFIVAFKFIKSDQN